MTMTLKSKGRQIFDFKLQGHQHINNMYPNSSMKIFPPHIKRLWPKLDRKDRIS